MSTFFNQIKTSFVDVPIEYDKIGTATFLEASESLVKFLDLFESTAFTVVQNDLTDNINKICSRFLTNPVEGATLLDLVLSESKEESKTATQAFLWLTRGLQFTCQSMIETVQDPSKELTVTFTSAYNKTLSQYHGMMVKPIFRLAMKTCPYRKDLFQKLGSDQDKVKQQLNTWLQALEKIVTIIMDFFASGNYGKGL